MTTWRCWQMLACLRYCCCKSFKSSFQQGLRHIRVFQFGFMQKNNQPLMTAWVIEQQCSLSRPIVLFSRVLNYIHPKWCFYLLQRLQVILSSQCIQYTLIYVFFYFFMNKHMRFAWSVLDISACFCLTQAARHDTSCVPYCLHIHYLRILLIVHSCLVCAQNSTAKKTHTVCPAWWT